MADGSTLGPYTLRRRLGVGGMAEVWEATHAERPDERVAIKVMVSGGSSATHRHKFIDEARIGSALRHPNIVRTIDVGLEGETLYLVMELLEGQSLAQARGEGQSLPIGLAVSLTLQALEGLSHAHTLAGPDGRRVSIVHRDIKPSNLFVTVGGDLKVIDFGIATASGLDRTRTRTGMFRGSLPYTTPEQTRNEPADARSDLFSLGLVVHELLTGRRVLDQGGEAAIVSALLWSPVPPVRSRREEVPVALDRAIAWALEKDRAQRPESAAAFAQALRESVDPSILWPRERIATWVRQSMPRNAATPLVGSLRPAAVVHTASVAALPLAPAPGAGGQGTASTSSGRQGGAGRASVGSGLKAVAAAPRPVAGPAPTESELPTAAGVGGARTQEEVPRAGGSALRPGAAWRALLVGLPLLALLAAGGAAALRRWQPEPEPLPVPLEGPPAVAAARPTPVPATPPEATPTSAVEPPEPPSQPEPDSSAKKQAKRLAAAQLRKRAAQKPATVEAGGWVTVDSRPTWARILIDGNDLGPTPVYRHRVAAGRHTVEAVRNDGAKQRRVIKVSDGREEKLVLDW